MRSLCKQGVFCPHKQEASALFHHPPLAPTGAAMPFLLTISRRGIINASGMEILFVSRNSVVMVTEARLCALQITEIVVSCFYCKVHELT